MSKTPKINFKSKIDLGGLIGLTKALKRQFVAKVGFLGNSTHDEESGLTNAQLAMIHETGSKKRNIPPRSILRLPMQTKGEDIAKEAAKAKKRIEKGLANGSSKSLFNALGNAAANMVREGFATGGWGQWEPNAPSTIAAKKSSLPLTHTGELAKSVDFKVVSSGK